MIVITHPVLQARYKQVAKWARGIDLFRSGVVLIPINLNLHWSLILVCNLKSLCYEGGEGMPCIVHLDSLGHPSEIIYTKLVEYLKLEWKSRNADQAEPEFNGSTFPLITAEVRL